jgi:hypothetical protein
MSVTTIKLDSATRDQLRELAGEDTYDQLLRRMIRRERAKRLADQITSWQPTPAELAEDDLLTGAVRGSAIAR